MTTIYYLFSSLSYLQFFIPLVIESKKRGYKNTFILRKTSKSYGFQYDEENLNILEKYLKEYDIKIKLSHKINLKKISGIVFMIDGDIYGPPFVDFINESLLHKLDSNKTIKISMTEHMNFWDVYHHFIDKIDYAFFSNHHMIDQMEDEFKKYNGKIFESSKDCYVDTKKSYRSEKNIFIGNTKFDNIPSKEDILEKFNLSKDEKYCLLLYPKMTKNYSSQELLNIYQYIHQLGFKIIVKTRPKHIKTVPKEHQGDHFIVSDLFPNESVELMKVCQLCIIASSSANEETVYSEIPCIDIMCDFRTWGRNEYLVDNKINVRIENKIWRKMSFEDFQKVFDNLEKKESEYFKKIKTKYLFTHNNTSERIFNFIKEKYSNILK